MAEEQMTRAKPRHLLELALGVRGRCELRRPPAAARGEIGYGVDRRLGRAEAGEQLEIGDRADIVRTDQPQPGDLIGGRRHVSARPWPLWARCLRQAGRCWRD